MAGALHLMLVMRTAAWHGGLNLYNNGFAGGLTATLLVGIIGWWSSWNEVRHVEGGNGHHDQAQAEGSQLAG